MSSLFCCSSIQPYRPQTLSHQAKFTNFMTWASFPRASTPSNDSDEMANADGTVPAYAIQLVRQVNFGNLESKRYFIPVAGSHEREFVEILEDGLIQNNFQKLNSYV